jgi:hypothetical protein
MDIDSATMGDGAIGQRLDSSNLITGGTLALSPFDSHISRTVRPLFTSTFTGQECLVSTCCANSADGD